KMWKRWWLLHATDFQSLMYPCFTIGRILGIFPYRINASTFDASKPWYILSTIVICICVIYDIMLIHALIYKVNLGDIIKNLEAIFYYTCSGFIMIITHMLSVPRMRLLQTILKISAKLPSKSYEKLSRFIHVKDILGTISVIVQMYMYFPKTEMFNSLSSLAKVFTVYHVLVVFQTNMLYINCVYVLKACFKNINDNLMHIQRLMVNDTRPLCVPILMGNIKSILLIELKILKKRHLMLSTIIHHFTQMMLLVWICESGKNQAQQIRTTIHDLLNNTNDKQIKDELQLFSLQLLHRDNTFSAKGLNVDATLFAAVKMKIADQKMPWLHHAKQKSHVISSRDFSESHPPVACGEESPRDHVMKLREIPHHKERRSMMDMMYMNCVCVLKACFTRINDNLMSMRSFIANNELSVPRLNFHNHGNPSLIMELKALKRQHLTISDTVQMLNIIFSLQLLATVVMTLSIITICLYFYILAAKASLVNMNFLMRVLFHAFFLLYMAYFFIKILLVVWACETGRAQAQQISTSIHDVFNVTTDEKIKDELQIFSLQVLHCDNKFSAKCFTIDAKLLAAVSNILHASVN
ncbi:hypothetical protein ALC57_12973, partial [Trachymyrmex cornetzi]